MVQGRTVSALTDSAIAGLSVRVGNGAAVTSDSQGFFDVDAGRSGAFRTTIHGGGIVERETAMVAPSRECRSFRARSTSQPLTRCFAPRILGCSGGRPGLRSWCWGQ